MIQTTRWIVVLFLLSLVIIVTAACARRQPRSENRSAIAIQHATEPDAGLPVLQPADLADGRPLNVVATSNIVADIVAAIGGHQIHLTDLLPVGADPHSYEPKPADLRALHDADVIFINGLGLEEAMDSVLNSPQNQSLIISVNAGVDTIELSQTAEPHDDHSQENDHEDEHGADHEDELDEADQDEHDQDNSDGQHNTHAHAGVDPHTWLDAANVIAWTETIASVLGELDPNNKAHYAENAERTVAELAALDAEIREKTGALPATARKLVTDHDSLSHYARAYGFDVIGSVIPSFSTLASPSAQQLAALQEQIDAQGVNAIFVSTSVNPRTAQQIADDTDIAVIPLYIGSLSDVNDPAPTYIDLMRANTDAIVEALK